MTGEELLHGLGEGELHIHHAAVGKHHDEKGEPAPGLTHRNRAIGTPIDLGAFTGSEAQGEEGRRASGAYLAYIRLDDGIATLEACFLQALEDLLGTIGGDSSHWLISGL